MALTKNGPGSEWLNGASLMLADAASLPQLAASELQTLQACGAREVLGLDPHRSDGQVIRLTIREPQRSLAAWWHRRKQRLTAVARWALKPLPSGRAYQLELPKHRGAAAAHDSENNLFARYAIRVGSLQLPPLPVRTELLHTHGDGRYYVFGRSLTFSLPRAAGRSSNIAISPADALTDEFHAEEVAAPLGDSGRAVPGAARRCAGDAVSVSPLAGTGGSVIFMGHLLPEDVERLERIRQTQAAGDRSVTLITVTPLPADLVARLPEGFVHCNLDRSPIDEWLGFVPDLSTHRDSLWPYWSECGQIPAVLLGQIRKRSPRQLVGVGNTARQYLHRLEIAGCLPEADFVTTATDLERT